MFRTVSITNEKPPKRHTTHPGYRVKFTGKIMELEAELGV
jgi:hypothetical protein